MGGCGRTAVVGRADQQQSRLAGLCAHEQKPHAALCCRSQTFPPSLNLYDLFLPSLAHPPLCPQQAFSEVKGEVRELLAKHHVTQMTMKPVKRQYAFENTAVPHGSQWVLKVGWGGVAGGGGRAGAGHVGLEVVGEWPAEQQGLSLGCA